MTIRIIASAYLCCAAASRRSRSAFLPSGIIQYFSMKIKHPRRFLATLSPAVIKEYLLAARYRSFAFIQVRDYLLKMEWKRNTCHQKSCL